ncbi:MAG: right-handed parallel beta-helix repeat-containing protein [Acetobacteraceae bacterium]
MTRTLARAALACSVLALAAPPAAAATLEVGPGKRFATPSEAAAAARAGDRIVISPGRYVDCAVWRADRLTIAAAPGGEVVITGPICGQKGLFVIAGRDVTVEGLTFVGAAFEGGNAAGIRAEGGSLTVRRSTFRDNQNGILTRHDMRDHRLLIEDSRFIGNGALLHDCAHGLYAGFWREVAIRRTRFEATRVCHHVKSRAARTVIEDSAILDTPGNRASYLVDAPNGGDLVLRGNTLRKGPDHGNPEAAIVHGAEGRRRETREIVISGNRFENLQPRPTVFFRLYGEGAPVLSDNRLHGEVTPFQRLPGRP